MTAPPLAPSRARWPLAVAALVILASLAAMVAWPSRAPASLPGKAPATSASAARLVMPVAVARLSRASVAGAVRDEGGKPVAGASVCAWPRPGEGLTSAQLRVPRCVATGADGTYRLEELLARTPLTVGASAQGFLPGRYRATDGEEAVRLEESEQRTGVDLVLVSGGVAVRGRVNDATGGPVVGAVVTSPDEELRAAAISDDRGEFTLWLAPGFVSLQASAHGYANARVYGPAPEHFFTFHLMPGATLVGRTVLAGSETPVADASISSIQVEGGNARSVVHTDEEGRFRVEGLAPGRYRIEATSPHREGYSRSSVTLALGETSSEVVVEMDPAYAVHGRVVDKAGNPCTAGHVTITDEHQNEFSESAIDADGWARMNSVIPGDYEVSVVCEDAIRKEDHGRIVIVDRDAPEQRWEVERGSRVRVSVVDAQGKPVRRARVVAQASDEREGSTAHRMETDGTYLLGGLAAGPFEVTARSDEGATAHATVTVDGRGEERVKLELSSVGSIEGLVEDEDHHPVAGVRVTAKGGGYASAMSLDDGTFLLTGLAAGAYRVQSSEPRAGEPRAARGAKEPADREDGEQVTVTAPGRAKVKLVVARRDGLIEGRVVDGAGGPIGDAFVECWEAGGKGRTKSSQGAPIVTDPDGRFRIERLRPGSYRVRATRKGGGEASAEEVATGRRDLTLRMAEGASIAGLLLSPKGPVERFELSARRQDPPFSRHESFFHAGGAFSLRDLPAGTYTLTAENPGGVATAEITLTEGERKTDLRLMMKLRGAVEGRVLALEGGAPVAGVRVSIDGDAPGGVWTGAGRKGAVTGPDGRFRLEGVLAGRWMLTLTPEQPPSSFDSISQPVVVAEGDRTDVGAVRVVNRRFPTDGAPGETGLSLKLPDGVETDSAGVEVSSSSGVAAAAGLQEGDRIVAIDGHDVRGDRGALAGPLTQVAAGQTLTLTLARGVVVKLTAASSETPPAEETQGGEE